MPDFPTQPFNQQVFIAPQQLQGFVDSVDKLNTAINRIAGSGTVGNGGSFRTVRDEAEVAGEGGEIGSLEFNQRAAATQAISLKRGHARQVKERMKEVEEEKILDKQIKLLQTYGDYTTKQAQEIQKGLKSGESITDLLNGSIIKKFNEVLDKEGTTRFSQILTAVEDSGIRQLRFGELPTQDILRAAGTLASRYYGYRYQKAAEQQGINPEELASGAAVPKLGRMTGLLGSIGPALATAGKFVGAADVIGDLAKHYYERGIGAYRDLTASGQLTGQGTEAGFAAKYLTPLSLWQPFGRIGWGTASEIVQQTREQGFTGPKAGQMEQGLANVIGNLGIQVGQATEFFTQSLREGGMSVGQVVSEMNKFHDATFNLNMNINDYTQQIMSATENLRDMGAGTTAPALAQQITAALPRAYRSPEGTQFLTGAFEKSRGVLASMVGHGANVLNITSQRYAKAGWSAMDTLLEREIQRAKDQGYTTPNDIANYLSQTSPFFSGTNVNMLQQYIQRVQHGRGIGAQISLSQAAKAYTTRFDRARREIIKYGSMTSEQLKSHNLQLMYKDVFGGITSNELDAKVNQYSGKDIIAGYQNIATGKLYKPNQYRSIVGDTYNISKAHQAKEALIHEAERSKFLNPLQISELQKSDPRHITQILTQIMQAQSGPKVNIGTQVGTITIELAKNAQGAFTLVKERQQGVANGSIQANTTNK